MFDEIIDRKKIVKIIQMHSVKIEHALFVAGEKQLACDGLVFIICHKQRHHPGPQGIDTFEFVKGVRGRHPEFFLVFKQDRVKFVVPAGILLDTHALVDRLVDLVAGVTR